MDLLSGLIGAVVGSVLVILWQNFTDTRVDRKSVTLEAADSINQMRQLLNDIYIARERNSNNIGNIVPHERWDTAEKELYRLLYAVRVRMNLKLIYGSEKLAQEYMAICGLMINAYRTLPIHSSPERWVTNSEEYRSQLSTKVAPAVDAFEKKLEQSCKPSAIVAETFVSIVTWAGRGFRGLLKDG